MRRRHLHGIASVVLGSFVLLAVGTRAQDVSGPTGFRATAEIVQFDALFLNGEGRPVTDIRKEEVTVRQGGTPVPLRDLRVQVRPPAVAPPTALAASPPSSPSDATAAQAPADVDVEPWIFLIDDLAMSPDAFERTKIGLRMLFEQDLPAGVEVGLLRTGELGSPKTPLTADRAALHRAVSQMRYKVNRWRGGVVSRSGALGAGSGSGDRVFLEGTLGSLNSLILHLRPLPGRKVVVLLSEFVALTANDFDVEPGAMGRIATGAGQYAGVAGRFKRLGYVAAASGVTVHAVNVLGAVSISGGGRAELNEGLHAVADELGGVYFRASNDVQDRLAHLMTVEQGHYVLAYVPPDGTFDDRAKTRFVPVSVSVSRHGVTVRTRQGFFTR